MLLFYRIIINLVFLISPLILVIRIISKKETLKSFFEKVGNISKKKVINGKSINGKWKSIRGIFYCVEAQFIVLKHNKFIDFSYIRLIYSFLVCITININD